VEYLLGRVLLLQRQRAALQFPFGVELPQHRIDDCRRQLADDNAEIFYLLTSEAIEWFGG
jgi:hypothetical protein